MSGAANSYEGRRVRPQGPADHRSLATLGGPHHRGAVREDPRRTPNRNEPPHEVRGAVVTGYVRAPNGEIMTAVCPYCDNPRQDCTCTVRRGRRDPMLSFVLSWRVDTL